MEVNSTALGGDRLGSGAKSTVELQNFQKSNFNLSRAFKSTMTVGTLTPCFIDVFLNGDELDINIDSLIRTMPNVTALFGSFKFQVDFFEVPLRLYMSSLRMNDVNVGYEMDKILFPKIEFQGQSGETFDQSSLPAYLGVRGMNSYSGAAKKMVKNAIPFLAYYDIYKNYYTNKQEGYGAVISNWINDSYIEEVNFVFTDYYFDQYGYSSSAPTGISPKYSQITFIFSDIYSYLPLVTCNIYDDNNNIIESMVTKHFQDLFTITTDNGLVIVANCKYNISIDNFYYYRNSQNDQLGINFFPLDNIDEFLKTVISRNDKVPFTINSNSKSPFNLFSGLGHESSSSICSSPMLGLALKTYQSDLFNNWLSTSSIAGLNGISELTKINTDDGLTIDSFVLAKKMWDLLNRIAVTGGSYNDWQAAVYGQKGNFLSNAPTYLGGYSCEIVFEEVVSTGNFEDAPLGYVSTKGTTTGSKGGYINHYVNEPCFIIGIASITPRLDYSQGNKWFMNLENMDELHKPSLDGIGWQDLITEQMCHWDAELIEDGIANYRSAGKVPAYINYMTAVNETYGDFASQESLMGMTLNRNYTKLQGRIADLTTYIDPTKFNYVFANSGITAQNFWVQLGYKIIARRKLSSKQIPFL